MQKIATLCLSLVFFLLMLSQAQGQGCVAIRQMGGCSGVSGSALLGKGQFQVGANYRYFRSFRHFKGTEEQKERLVQHTEVINNSHALDLNVTYGISNRLSVNAAFPLAFNDRSSLYEHDKINRYHTQSHGLGDIRFGASYWLLNPDKFRKGNIAFGLGVKAPSGNYQVKDEFHSGENGAIQVKTVDQSIQLGDGGWGVSAELQGFVQIFHSFGMYGNAFYLSNPRETNGVSSGRKLPAPNSSIIEFSVPDQFLTRLGFTWVAPFQNVQFSLGARYEGVTVYDLIGGSNGFRRPGTVLAVEPGLAWFSKNVGITFTMPYALKRNRTQSYTDKLSEQIDVTDKVYHGDAAFADYSINAGIVWRFNGKHATIIPAIPAWNEVKK
ncbi:MAG: hypothetical protein WCR52_07475 [Bacteroidota bacterium]